VGDLDDDDAGTGLGHGEVADLDVAVTGADRGRHGIREHGQAP
jgi:hypothetical protein